MKKLLVIILILNFIFLNGCIERKISIKDSESDYIVYDAGKLPKDLLMLNIRDVYSKDMLYALFTGLVNVDENGKIQPGLADSWKISSDGIEYRFEISPDAYWSDGSEIKASDFVDFFSAILKSDTENAFDYQLFSIYGVQDYRQKKTKFDKVAIRAESDKELVIRLNSPCPDLLYILSQPIYGLRNNVSNLKDWRNKFKEIRYSGPFIISGIDSSGEVMLEKNTYYKDSENVTSEKIKLTSKESPEAAFVDYEMNKVNILQDPPFSEVKDIINDENTFIAVTSNIVSLTFNFNEKSIGRDSEFRKAVSEALDSSELANAALPEFSIPASSFFNSNSTKNIFTDSAFKGNTDREQAKRDIDGLKEEKPKAIKLIGLNNDINKRISKAAADQIKKYLDINVQCKLYNDEELYNTIDSGNFDLLINTYRKDYNSDVSLLEKWISKSKENLTKYSNPSFDSTFSKLQLEGDKEKRSKYLNECQNILKKDMPVVYLFNDARIIVKSSNVEGLNITPFGNIDLTGIRRTDKAN